MILVRKINWDMRKFLMRFYSTHKFFFNLLLFNNNFPTLLSCLFFRTEYLRTTIGVKQNQLSFLYIQGEDIIAMKNTTKRKSEENW